MKKLMSLSLMLLLIAGGLAESGELNGFYDRMGYSYRF